MAPSDLRLDRHEECGPECCYGAWSCLGVSPEECAACFLLGAEAHVGIMEGTHRAIVARMAAHAFNGGSR